MEIRTLKGSLIARLGGIVGKRMGTRIYVHRRYADRVLPPAAVHLLRRFDARYADDWGIPAGRYCVTYDIVSDRVRVDEAKDFDTAREPHVGRFWWMHPSGIPCQSKTSQAIWHHKWLWVMDDYDGFDVAESRRWSATWLARLAEPAKGTDRTWQAQLRDVGLGDVGVA